MDAARMDMMRAACDVQDGLRRLEAAAVEFDLACEAVHDAATGASEWCRDEDRAELASVSEALGGRLADVRETVRDLRRAAVCVADGVIGEAMGGMSDRERLEAWGMLIHSAVPEVDVMDSEGRMLAKGRRIRRVRSRRRNRQGGAHE